MFHLADERQGVPVLALRKLQALGDQLPKLGPEPRAVLTPHSFVRACAFVLIHQSRGGRQTRPPRRKINHPDTESRRLQAIDGPAKCRFHLRLHVEGLGRCRDCGPRGFG